jgi:hypothetical protein
LRGARVGSGSQETGGVLQRSNGSRVRFAGTGPQHAAEATKWLRSAVAGLSPRIQRIYGYSWRTSPFNRAWDSDLIGPDGIAWAALAVLSAAVIRASR